MFSYGKRSSDNFNIANPSEFARWREKFFQTRSGVSVTYDKALAHSAVWASVNFISSAMAMLPLGHYIKTDSGSKVASDLRHRLVKNRPSISYSSYRWRQIGIAQMLLKGNAYSFIERDNLGSPIALHPLPIGTMKPVHDGDGNVLYRGVDRKGRSQIWLASDILHIAGFGYDGVCGLGAIEHYMREVIGLGLAAQEFGSAFFGDGTNTNTAFIHPEELGDEAHKRLEESLIRRTSGLQNAMKPLVLEEGMQVQSLGIPPEQAQFLETRRANRIEIAGMFNLPPIFIGEFERATFSNAEQMDIYLAKYTLTPIAVRIEQELNDKLLTMAEQEAGHHFKFNMSGVLRGDTKTRALYYKTMRDASAITGNEIREKEDLPHIDGLDDPLLPLNMTTPAGMEQLLDEPTGSQN